MVNADLSPITSDLGSLVQVVVNTQKQQVDMWLVSKCDTGRLAPGIACTAGERVLVEVSRKFTPERLQGLAYNSGFYLQARIAGLPAKERGVGIRNAPQAHSAPFGPGPRQPL